MSLLSLNESALRGWTHALVVNYNDFSAAIAGTLADDATVSKTLDIPAGSVVHKVGVKLNTAFDDSGGGSSLTVIVGDSGDPNGFIEAAQLHGDGTEISYVWNTGDAFLGEAGTTDPENVTNGELYTSAETITATFTPSSYSLNEVTTGEVTIYFDISTM